MTLALIVSFVAAPATASVGQPPWWVRARHAVEKRFSLTSELFYERQESLRIAAFDQFLQVVDLQTGEEQGFRLPGDPALLNRKFDLRFEEEAAGPGLSIALPTVGSLFPTLTVDAAWAEVSLDFHDVTESRDSTSLRGQGALFDTRLDVVAAPCRRCPWFTAASYRFEKLPSVAVDRSPRFDIQGFSIARDDVQLGREVHEVSSHVGYAAPGGRVTSFVGVEHRWTDLDIDDRIAYRDRTSESRLSSRTRLESEATLAVAGLDFELGSQWSGRLETAVGDDDWSAWIGFAFQPLSNGRPTERIRNARLAREIARLHTELLQEIATLPQVGWLAAAQALLDRYEKRLLDLLPLPEFDALQSLVRYRFDEVRQQLTSAAKLPIAPSSAGGLHARYVPASRVLLASEASSRVDCGSLRSICVLVARLAHIFEVEDLKIHLCVQTEADRDERPERFKVNLLPWMYLEGNRDPWATRDAVSESTKSLKVFETDEDNPIPRGLYGYLARRALPGGRDYEQIACPPDRDCALLDLVELDFPFVVCNAEGCRVREHGATWSGCPR